MFKLKRVYEPPAADDGFRVLVDRLWPRGVSKEQAALDVWLKDVAPSPALRAWFGHDPAKFDEFAERYQAELAENPAAEHLRRLEREHQVVTLVYAAKDVEHNHAFVLREFLRSLE